MKTVRKLRKHHKSCRYKSCRYKPDENPWVLIPNRKGTFPSLDTTVFVCNDLSCSAELRVSNRVLEDAAFLAAGRD